MSERGFHCIEDDISETWLEDWAGAGIGELEAYLAKHADFLRVVDGRDTAQGTGELTRFVAVRELARFPRSLSFRSRAGARACPSASRRRRRPSERRPRRAS